MTRTVLVTGAGGVGKTTFSAALAVTAARRGVRTLVVTVDPARRLASALGLTELGDEPQPHLEEPNLWAAMLDSAASWRAVAMRHADPDVATRLADNEFFRAASEHFPASQAYAAADQAATFVQARAWDMVIVDTPPSGGGIDFFTAPAQMADLVGGRLLRWITGGPLPGRRFFYDRAARPMLRAADTILGSGWASAGYSAANVDPASRGVGYLLHEGGIPQRLRSYYLDDASLASLSARAEDLRRLRPRPGEV